MDSLEQERLADFIKKTHLTLREEARIFGPEIAWRQHVARQELLQAYASKMRQLATTCWKERKSKDEGKPHCRIQWIKSECEKYFLRGGREKYEEREADIQRKMKLQREAECRNGARERRCEELNKSDRNENVGEENRKVPVQRVSERSIKVSMLDVGSCYNPFDSEDMFHVTAIDLTAAADKSVLRCDFLNVGTGKDTLLSEDGAEILQLPENAFDVVVFSLFIEYLPCPKQRHRCCEKAHKLVKPSGLLILISPDSKHMGANAKLMKHWRYELSKMGFMRVKYEKLQHLHCLAFRKCIVKDVAVRWAWLQTARGMDVVKDCRNMICIPQDFQRPRNSKNMAEAEAAGEDEDDGKSEREFDPVDLILAFSELPNEF